VSGLKPVGRDSVEPTYSYCRRFRMQSIIGSTESRPTDLMSAMPGL